jgi:hypothetical protein
MLAYRQVETPDWLRKIMVGASLPDGAKRRRCLPDARTFGAISAGGRFPGNWTNECSLPERLRCQGELNVFHLLPIGAIGRFTDRTSDKR